MIKYRKITDFSLYQSVVVTIAETCTIFWDIWRWRVSWRCI